MMLICPAGGMHALPREVRWTDIAGLRLVGLQRDNPMQRLIDEQLVRAGRSAAPDATCNFLETQIAMVEAGAGAAVTPSSTALACVKRKVTMHALVDPVVWTDFCWESSSERELSRSAEDFGEFLKGYLEHIADQAPRAHEHHLASA
jgi:DNA-binding transcriptional LysR family regulator